eukprot:13343420-Alexandrium_andersonii.AAC.1
MSASLVGSEMCIRDRAPHTVGAGTSRHTQRTRAGTPGGTQAERCAATRARATDACGQRGGKVALAMCAES